MPVRTLMFVSFAALVAMANLPALRAWYEYSRSDGTASHLILIPLVTCGLIVLARRTIFAAVGTSWRAGGAVALTGAALWFAVSSFRGAVDQKLWLGGVIASLVVVWIGAFVFCYGSRAARRALFPLCFLMLMAPLPDAVLMPVNDLLKNGSTETVAWLFALTGTPYYRQHYVFALPTVVIEVADACSGIRSTIGLMITSFLAGHMFLSTAWKKAALVLVIMPITVVKNAVRIVTLSLLSIHVDPSYLTGQLHHEGGIVFFVLALAMIAPLFLYLVKSDRPSNRLSPHHVTRTRAVAGELS